MWNDGSSLDTTHLYSAGRSLVGLTRHLFHKLFLLLDHGIVGILIWVIVKCHDFGNLYTSRATQTTSSAIKPCMSGQATSDAFCCSIPYKMASSPKRSHWCTLPGKYYISDRNNQKATEAIDERPKNSIRDRSRAERAS